MVEAVTKVIMLVTIWERGRKRLGVEQHIVEICRWYVITEFVYLVFLFLIDFLDIFQDGF